MENLRDLFARHGLEKIRLNAGIIQADISIEDADRDAAWEMYVEMLTRIVTQPLPDDTGDEKAALESVHALFPVTREILRRHGRQTIQFSKVAIPVLNQMVRPFTAKWHRLSLSGAFEDEAMRSEFREDLRGLLADMRNYIRMLAEIAKVEDLTDLETEKRCVDSEEVGKSARDGSFAVARKPRIPVKLLALLSIVAVIGFSTTFVWAGAGAQECVTGILIAQHGFLDNANVNATMPAEMGEKLAVCVNVFLANGALSLIVLSLAVAVLGASLSDIFLGRSPISTSGR